jgi:hypothetical protein
LSLPLVLLGGVKRWLLSACLTLLSVVSGGCC